MIEVNRVYLLQVKDEFDSRYPFNEICWFYVKEVGDYFVHGYALTTNFKILVVDDEPIKLYRKPLKFVIDCVELIPIENECGILQKQELKEWKKLKRGSNDRR